MTDINNNPFTLSYYESIIRLAQSKDYDVVTLREYHERGHPKYKHLILRHDLDTKPSSLGQMLLVEKKCNARSTVFVRVHGEYNLFNVKNFREIKNYHDLGWEIGLHTNFVEFSKIGWSGFDSEGVLDADLKCLRAWFEIDSLSTHRDLNYMYNSLPWLEENWDVVKIKYNLKYHAYESCFMENSVYVNEGFGPHLCWRNKKPEEVMGDGRSVYLLTHPHWWYTNYAHEHF